MPSGDFASGLGPMGLDPVLDPSTRIVAPAPAALLYDPAIRDWTLDENENPNAAHPVDQQIAVELFFAAKSIRSSPDTGNEIGAITHIDPARHANKVTDIITRKLKRFVEAGSIRVIAITVEAEPGLSRTLARVRYKNLLTNAPEQTVPVG